MYVNLRFIKSFKGIKLRYEDVDLVVVRENIEDLYVGIEYKIGDYVVESIKIIIRSVSERIVDFVCNYVKDNKRKKVIVIYKVNIMKMFDGLFLDVFREVVLKYGVEYDDLIVDVVVMNLVLNLENYDVMVMLNFYGDILLDLGVGFVGGLGIILSVNIGKDCVIFEVVYGSVL